MTKSTALALLFFSMMMNLYLLLPTGWAMLLTLALLLALVFEEDFTKRGGDKNSD